MEPDRLKADIPAEAEEKDVPNRAEKAFSIFAAVFFGLAVLVLLVMIYVLLRGCFAALFWLAVWLLLARRTGSPLLLPSPWAVAARLGLLAAQPPFWGTVGVILLSTLLSFLISLLEILG